MEEASGLAAEGHVLEEGDVIWNASLSMVNLDSGVNSYYKLQIIQMDNKVGPSVFVFFSILRKFTVKLVCHFSFSLLGPYRHIAWWYKDGPHVAN